MKKLLGLTLIAIIVLAGSPANAGKQTTLELKAMLGGAYNTDTGLMNDSLRSAGLLPVKEPYTGLGYHFTTGEQAVADASVFAIEGEDAIIDWVVLEIRARRSGTPVIYSRSALIQADGDIVDVDGISNIVVPHAGFDHYIALRHRNHLAVMSARSLNLKNGYDFTTMPIYGNEGSKVLDGVQALWGGNANFNGNVSYMGAKNDHEAVGVVVGMENPNNVVTGYYGSDTNMDGVVKYTGSANDRDLILANLNGTPTFVRYEQMPKVK